METLKDNSDANKENSDNNNTPVFKAPANFNPIIKFGVNIWGKVKTTEPIKVLLIVLQIISGSTTIAGANMVLPRVPPFIYGFTIQSLLFGGAIQLLLTLLLIFKAGKSDPVKRWFAIWILTFVSIYTSFFSIYNQITGEQLTENSPKKIQAHENLKAQLYTPIKADFERLNNSKKTLERYLKDEESGKRGVPGIGPKWQELRSEIDQIEKEIDKLSHIVNDDRLKQAFIDLKEDKIQKMTPKYIYDKDIAAWSVVPPEYRKKVEEPQQLNYIDSEAFLVPFNEIMKGNQNAIVTLIIALIIDGLAIILGSIGPKDPLSLFQRVTRMLTLIITGVKRSHITIIKVLSQNPMPFDTQLDGLQDSVSIIRLMQEEGTKERGSNFLIQFYECINWQTKIIDTKTLFNDKNKSFKIGYRILIDAMHCWPLNWIEKEKDEYEEKQGVPQDQLVETKWRISEHNYHSLVKWLREEMSRQLEDEQVQAAGTFEIRIYHPL